MMIRAAKRAFANNRITPLIQVQKCFSSSIGDSYGDKKEEKLVYEGVFAGKLRMLRRVSITSSCFTVFGLPAAVSYLASNASVLSQYALSGVIMFTTVSSTLFLHLVTHPYVAKMYELPQNGDSEDKRFKAYTYNLFGNYVTTEFKASEIAKAPGMSVSFSNCAVNGKTPLYIQHDHVNEPKLASIIEELQPKRVESDD